MDRPAPLPLPLEALPEALRRFASASAPAAARTMAAKGLVPVKGPALTFLLAQLAADPDPAIAHLASASLDALPEPVLFPALEGLDAPSVLEALARRFAEREEALLRIAANRATSDATLADIAALASEALAERIALNETRLLGAPEVIEALYKNRNTRMSTADRLVELCARNGVTLEGIPAFRQHVESLRGQLIAEPSDVPLPGDSLFQDALAADDADQEAIERDDDGEETLRERYRPLSFRIREMSVGERIRLSVVGDAASRALLVRDPNRVVAMAAISSPAMRDVEAINIAYSREVSEDILRFIGNRGEWLKSYEIKKALTFNPKTPVAISMRLLVHLRQNDLKLLARSRGVPSSLKTLASQRLVQRGDR